MNAGVTVIIGGSERHEAETHQDVVAVVLLAADGLLAERHLPIVDVRMLAYGLRQLAHTLDREGEAQGLPRYRPPTAWDTGNPLEVTCPFCGALPGVRCTSVTGKVLGEPHAIRLVDAYVCGTCNAVRPLHKAPPAGSWDLPVGICPSCQQGVAS